MFDLTGKVAVVTGAASGIGRATAHRLAAAGARVFIADIDETGGKEAAREVGGTFVATDVSREDDVEQAMTQAATVTGRLDIVINNAGIALATVPITNTTHDHFQQHMEINTHGVLYGIKHAAPRMGPGSAVVNTASVLGVFGLPEYGSYAASKFAIVGLTKVAAIELGPRGIRVNAVCPTTVNTPMLASFPEAKAEAATLSMAAPLGRIIDPGHVAAAIHFLAADDCPAISGQALMLDCGITSGVSRAFWDVASNLELGRES
jgi:3alpha(or 20beta)-hydroxysteroid dehydrogenase